MPAIKRPRSMAGTGESSRPKKKTKITYKVATYSKTPMASDNRLLRTAQQATVRYYDNYGLAPNLTLPGYNVFSANGCYDPDISGVGHQPRGFDQLMALYDRFQVDEVLIEAEFSTPMLSTYSATTGNQLICGIALLEDSTPRTLGRDYVESRVNDQCTLVPGNSSKKLKMTVKPNEFLGLPKRGEHGLTGSTGTNPAYQCFFHVWAVGSDGAAAPAVGVTVKITYKINLTEPKEPASS